MFIAVVDIKTPIILKILVSLPLVRPRLVGAEPLLLSLGGKGEAVALPEALHSVRVFARVVKDALPPLALSLCRS